MSRPRIRGIEEGQHVSLLIGDLPPMGARIQSIDDDHAVVRLMKEPEPPLQDIGPIQGIIEAIGPRGITRLIGTLKQHGDEVNAAWLDFDQGPEVIQRRQFVRIDTTTSVTVTRSNGRRDTTVTVNLSGAGVLLSGPADLQMDELLKLDIDVGEEEPVVHARGRVVRETGVNGKGVRFEMIEEGDRERLIHFVFERQRTQAQARAS
jgi:PilZ domain